MLVPGKALPNKEGRFVNVREPLGEVSIGVNLTLYATMCLLFSSPLRGEDEGEGNLKELFI